MKKTIFSRAWRQLTGDWSVLVEDSLPGTELATNMHQASIPSLGFFFMLGLATILATLGLIANSAPTIIGAMIVAPLMAPIIGFAFGLAIFDRVLIIRSLITVIAGVTLVVALAYLITLVFGMRIIDSEILNRTSPTLLDLGVAVAAGGAAAFAHTRKSIISSIAGVAIAVALVPPLAVSGIGLALGHKATVATGLSLSRLGLHQAGVDIASGSFLLFATNFIGIVMIAILVFIFQRYGNWKKAFITLFLFVGLSMVVFQPLNDALHRLFVKSRVVRLLNKLAHARPDIITGRARFESFSVTYRDGRLHVKIDCFSPRDELIDKPGMPLQDRIDNFRDYLMEDIGEPVVVEFDLIPVDMIRLRSEPPAESDG